MKKTLITLAALALASVAQAADPMTPNQWGHYSATNGATYDASTYQSSTPAPSVEGGVQNTPYILLGENVSATYELASGENTFKVVEGKSGSTFTKTGDGVLSISATNGAPTNVVVDDGTLKLANASNQRFGFNFVVNNGGTLDISGASQIYAESITLNGGSKFVFGSTAVNLDDATSALTLSSNVTLDLSAWGTSSTAFADGTTLFTSVTGLTGLAPVKIDFGGGDVALYQLSLSGGSVSAKAVPEPATATLSLLALAGLAARRRRK